jgi:hypothetical protein
MKTVPPENRSWSRPCFGSDLPIYGVMFIDCAYPLSQLA